MPSMKPYWRGIGESYGHRSGGEASHRDDPTGLSRRRFLALAAASAALGAAGCDRLSDRGEIVSYLRQPEGSPPGTLRCYASTLLRCPNAPPVLVVTREGRPVKLEGSPDHPSSMGALGAYGQAATLELYSPDRLRQPRYCAAGGARGKGIAVSWENADTAIRKGLENAGSTGKSILLLTPATVSPTTRALIGEFLAAYPAMRHVSVEMFHPGEAMEGRRRAFGSAGLPSVKWGRADVILSLGCDFLGEGAPAAFRRGFASGRRPDSTEREMNRLWVAEGGMTVTGCNADHRLRLRPGLQGRFLVWLLSQIVAERGIGPLAQRPDVVRMLSDASPVGTPSDLGIDGRVAPALVRDLAEHQGRSLVLAGDHLPASVHVLAAAVNLSLGNEGSVLDSSFAGPVFPVSSPAELGSAVDGMASGSVGVLINLQANPCYALPADLGFEEHLAKVPLVISSSLILDETGGRAHYLLPCTHDLESWGDTDAHAGWLSLQQPAIAPLFDARQCEDSILRWLPPADKEPPAYHDYLRMRWAREVYPVSGSAADFEDYWNTALHNGLAPAPKSPKGAQSEALKLDYDALSASVREHSRAPASGMELVLTPSARTWDGRFANNGWLQELPHPVTTQVWGNGAMMSRATAARIGCEEGDLVTLRLEDRSADLPALIEPGVADDVISVELGYGRRAAGSAGSGIGADAGTLRKNAGGLSPWLYRGLSAEPAGGRARSKPGIIRVQEHHDIRGGPDILETTEAAFRANPDLLAREKNPERLHSEQVWKFPGYKWGLVVDLTACIGCGACSAACTAENNVPVVGPEQVARGREMQWIRIDRYYSGPPEDPRTVFQPMMCQHCDNAPCEKVCPVAATAHSPEGLDEMVYNRCVGTRYCANNCPYKVRRFNFFDYHEGLASPAGLVYNPEVTVRPRGIMEKCTFCVQRITAAKHVARLEGRKVRDGDVMTACQQACPVSAIAFGDLNDPESGVHKSAESPRSYRVLETLGVEPSVTYLAKIRNPHPDVSE